METIRIYVTNLGKYNEGELVGKWLELPASDEEIEEVLEEIGIDENYEEYFISDYEAPFKIGEYDDLDEINDKVKQYESLCCEYDSEAINALLDEYYTLDELENLEFYIHYNVDSMSDIAYEYVHECCDINNMMGNLSNYFDYEALGRDMEINGTYIFYVDDEGNNCAIEILN